MTEFAGKNVRLIARLDIKGPNLIKGIQLEGLRVVGEPQAIARSYYEQGADELLYIDIVASLYNRNNLRDIIERAARDVYIPMTVGGGIRSTEDVQSILRSGADKVAINTAAVQRPELISEVARQFGAQCMVLGVEAKQIAPGRWEVFTDNGRERTGLDVVEWCGRGQEMGAGEILLTSVDREGTRKGFDYDLVRAVSDKVSIPIIASGGYGAPGDVAQVVAQGADAVAIADALHFKRTTVADIRARARADGVRMREFETAE